MLFRIDASSSEAVYAQVMNEIKLRVARGVLRPGDRLPSVRELARTLVINPNTVSKAYGFLESEGVIVSRQGQGTFVAEGAPELSVKARGARIRRLIDDLFTEAYHLGFDAEQLAGLVEYRSREFRLSDKPERDA